MAYFLLWDGLSRLPGWRGITLPVYVSLLFRNSVHTFSVLAEGCYLHCAFTALCMSRPWPEVAIDNAPSHVWCGRCSQDDCSAARISRICIN